MLEVLLSPNPLLLEKSVLCDLNDPELKKFAKQMQDTMYHYSGIGLAAPQVGVLKRIIVIDTEYDIEDLENTKSPVTLVNPEIIEKSKEMEDTEEGCLSCPGITAPVTRHKKVKVKYYDLDGQEHMLEAEGLLSTCLQHEIDHLDGKTLFQTSKPEVRLALLQEYREALAQGATPGQTS